MARALRPPPCRQWSEELHIQQTVSGRVLELQPHRLSTHPRCGNGGGTIGIGRPSQKAHPRRPAAGGYNLEAGAPGSTRRTSLKACCRAGGAGSEPETATPFGRPSCQGSPGREHHLACRELCRSLWRGGRLRHVLRISARPGGHEPKAASARHGSEAGVHQRCCSSGTPAGAGRSGLWKAVLPAMSIPLSYASSGPRPRALRHPL